MKSENRELGWKDKCIFNRNGSVFTWLVALKSPTFKIGCYICHVQNANTSWGRFEVSFKGSDHVGFQNIMQHGSGKKHAACLERLLGGSDPPPAPSSDNLAEAEDGGVTSTIAADVPRMDRWIQAVGLLCSRVGYEQQPKRVQSSEIGTRLIPAGTADSSKTVTRKMILCLEDGLREVDIARIRQCRAVGIAMDKGGDHLVVYGRLLGPTGVYEMLLGVVTPDMVQDSSRGMLEALQLLLKQVCTIPARCRRPADDMFNSPSDLFDHRLYDHLCDHIYTAVADGGPTEQRALFESAASGAELRQQPGYQPLLPHLRLITRDAAHRYRSIDKLVVSKLPTLFQETLEKLVTGERSIARLLEKSAKFSQLFLECQRDMADREDAASFSRFLKGFAFADHRFDSRKRPLVRLFTMLPIVMECLQRVTEGGTSFQDADVLWCRNLLQEWGGDRGYVRLVGSALIGDALVMSWPFLKLADKSEGDYSLTGVQAAECLSLLRSMLLQGAIWLPAAEGTLVHSVLGAIKQRVLFTDQKTDRSSVVVVRWPAPDSEARLEPQRLAHKQRDLRRRFRFLIATFNVL